MAMYRCESKGDYYWPDMSNATLLVVNNNRFIDINPSSYYSRVKYENNNYYYQVKGTLNFTTTQSNPQLWQFLFRSIDDDKQIYFNNKQIEILDYKFTGIVDTSTSKGFLGMTLDGNGNIAAFTNAIVNLTGSQVELKAIVHDIF